MEPLSIYIHIPFCEQKCLYCDFYSISNKNEYERYVENLLISIKEYSKKYHRKVCSIYFGGGTPSVLGSEYLCKILDEIKRNFEVLNDAEITVEVNPCSADKLDFKNMLEFGFNRLSIGLQSAIDSELKILGRIHTAHTAKNTVQKARNAGFKNISLDLMLCIPTQTKSSLTESIKFCKDCDVEHVSAYILKFEKNTPLYKIRDKFELFDDDKQAMMYLHTVSELKKYGYHQYEISNFSKKGFEGQHNLRYWKDKEYLGIGPSAHSFVDGKRFYYNRNLDEFYKGIIVPDGDGGDLEEFIMLSLRLKEGLDLKVLQSKYNFILNKNFIYKANKLKSENLITFENDVISLTTEGFLVSNAIIRYIIDSI